MMDIKGHFLAELFNLTFLCEAVKISLFQIWRNLSHHLKRNLDINWDQVEPKCIPTQSG